MTTADKLSADESYEDELEVPSQKPKPLHEVWTWQQWAHVFSGADGSGKRNETQRGMQSRHLMMIGEIENSFVVVVILTCRVF
jgi:hypothetical protein